MTLEETRRNTDIYRRLHKIAEDLREIVKETGEDITMAAGRSLNYGDQKPVHSTIFAGKYRMDHFNNGEEKLQYGTHMIEPRQMALGRPAPGLEYIDNKK